MMEKSKGLKTEGNFLKIYMKIEMSAQDENILNKQINKQNRYENIYKNRSEIHYMKFCS